MATIAELQINVDSSPTERATKALNDFAQAAERASTAGKSKAQSDNTAAGSSDKVATSEKKLADLIDYQSRKLSKLAEQRELVSKSGLQDKSVEAYNKLNSIIDANIALVQRQGNAQDILAAKQDRDLAKLQNIATSYDPLQRAILNYERNLKSLDEGYSSGKLSIDQYNAALDAQAAQLAKVRAAQPGSQENISKQYDQALSAVLPYRTELQNLANQERVLQQAKASGKVQTAAQIADYDAATAAIQRQRKEYEKRIAAGNNAGITFKQEQQALRGLPAQFTDIVVSLQGGQAPLTVLLQQGGQIKDTFGGIVPALKGVASGIAAIITPFTLLASTIALVTYEAYQGSQELTEFNKAVVKSGGFSGTSVSQFTQYRDQISSITGNAAQAADALVALESSGKIAGDAFVQIGVAAINMQKATGQSIQQTVDDFASLAKDPVNAVVALDDKYKFLTSSVLAQIDALQRNGDAQGAITLAQDTLANATDDAAKRMIENLGFVEKAWNAVKDAVSGTGSAIAGIGRGQSAAEELASLQANIARAEQAYRGTGPGDASSESLIQKDPLIQRDKERIKQLKIKIDYENFGAQQEAQAEAVRRAGTKATNEQNNALESNIATLDKVAAARLSVTKAEQQEAAIRKAASAENRQITADELYRIDITNKAAQKRVDDAIKAEKERAKGPSTPADTRQVQEVKSNLSVVLAEYDGYYKKVTALGEANLVSAEATYASQKAILEAQLKAVSSSYDGQIEEIRKLQGQKGNSAATEISLGNQLTKAEAARLKATEDTQTKLDQLAIKEQGRLKDQTDRIDAYRNALERQVETLRQQGERAAVGLGQGSRQNSLREEQNTIQDRGDQEALSLAEQYKAGSIGLEEYNSNLDDLRKNQERLRDQTVKNYEEMSAARADFTNGANAAWEDYFDNASDFAGKTYDIVSTAFDGLTDALYDFVLTGELSFNDLAATFAKAVLRMGIEWAAAQTLRLAGIGAETTATVAAEGVKTAAKVAANTTAAASSVAANATIATSEAATAGATFTAWLPAALVKSVGTAGAAAIVGGTALLAAFALIKGFSDGGYTGDGGVYDPAGIVHKGEVVWSQADIKRAGGVANVEALRTGGAPSVALMNSGSSSGTMSTRGDVNIPINVNVQAQAGVSDAEARKQAQVTADTVRGMMLQVIQQQKRPGGLLA